MKEFRMRIALTTIVITLIVLIINSCSSPSEPAYVPEPGRRDYEWTIDTIKVPLLVIANMWGSSPENIWATGFGAGGDYSLWYFDGKKWSANSVINNAGHGICGTSKNNVWVGQGSINNELQIWRYNGTNWEKNQKLSFDANYVPFISQIWGEKENEMYLVGWNGESKGFLYRYNGVYWQELKTLIEDDAFYEVRKLGDEIFITTYCDQKEVGKVYKMKNYNLSEVFSCDDYISLCKIDNRLFFQTQNKIFEYKYGKIIPGMDLGSNYVAGMVGRTVKDIFCLSKTGLGHYNGSDLQTILNFDIKRFFFLPGIVFENSYVFWVLDQITGYTIIYRGKLKEKEAK